jgi:N6-adenosine-specific RNA methylase IME4
MGFYSRQLSEFCLIATKGKPKVINHGIRSVQLAEEVFGEKTIFALNEKHSKKPDIFREKIVELMGDLPRVELFARKQTEGWDVFGDEVENSIKL